MRALACTRRSNRRYARQLIRGTFALALSAASLGAQQAAAPSCRDNLDSLAQRIETDYIGAKLELVGERRVAYERALTDFRARAARTPPDGCYAILSGFTTWFEDPHLFVFQSTRIDSAESARRAATVRVVDWREASARTYYDRRGAALDPIEGIWFDGRLRVAVVPDTTPDAFLAVVLTSDTASWPPGAVRARITKRADDAYDVRLWERNFAVRQLDGRIHKRVLLRLSPGIWGKEYPVQAADRGLLHPVDPHRATLLTDGDLAVVSIPSHDPTHRAALDSILRHHADALRRADRLIVDLRGNEGGSSWITNALLPYIVSERRRATPFDTGRAVMLSSPNQIAYARRAFGPDTSAFVRSLVARLEANPGAVVPLSETDDADTPRRADSVIVGPRRVAVLVDRGTVSAAEVLVLHAMRSERARVYGQPTAGALDYPSVNIVRISATERRWWLGYPAMAARASLPSGGMRGRGIPPDVLLDWSRIADPIRHVDALLRQWR